MPLSAALNDPKIALNGTPVYISKRYMIKLLIIKAYIYI